MRRQFTTDITTSSTYIEFSRHATCYALYLRYDHLIIKSAAELAAESAVYVMHGVRVKASSAMLCQYV